MSAWTTPEPTGPPPDYDPNTPEEIARADLLDDLDLAEGRDYHGRSILPVPAHTRTREERLAMLTERARGQFGLFEPSLDVTEGMNQPDPPPEGPPRDRRPSELARTVEFRLRDAERKRGARAAGREGPTHAA